MGTTVHVPQTRDMIGDELSGDEAFTALRHYGGRRLLTDSFARFRYADGFTNARALAFQVVLGLVPFTVALVGLATSVHTEGVGRIIELTLGRIVPGASADVVEDAFDGTRRSAQGDVWSTLALWLGLAFALLNLASAMGQIERGANRIYGIERDRPFLASTRERWCWRSRRDCPWCWGSSSSSRARPSGMRWPARPGGRAVGRSGGACSTFRSASRWPGWLPP